MSVKGPATTLSGIRIGHASDFRGLTGCTVVLCERGAVCGVDIRGSAAGTRDLTPCLPGHLVDRVHAIFLTGGSAFGLDAAAGVMQFLEARGVGFPAGRSRIPIVPSAVIFDLHLGSARAVRPVHTQFDGDLVFALSIGQKRADLNTLGTAAAEAMAQAIVRAVKTAKGRGGVPAWDETRNS